MKNILLACSVFLSSATFALPLEAILHTEAFNTLGLHNNQATVTTIHRASVTNNSDIVQTITVKYEICTENKGCDESHHYRVKVNPHATWQDGMTLHLYPTYMHPGHYGITGSTLVTGAGLNMIYPAIGYIEVR